jgi:hypothetical protein
VVNTYVTRGSAGLHNRGEHLLRCPPEEDHSRGLEAIIADDLVGNTLLLVSFMVGGLMGCVAILVELAAGFLEADNPGDDKAMAFTLGFVMGVVLCSILMSVIASAVNAVLRSRQNFSKTTPNCPTR